MTTKSIQKLPKYLIQNILNKSKGILLRLVLGILVASLFVPVFIATDPQNAVAAADCSALWIGLLKNPGVYLPQSDTVGITGSKIQISKSTVTLDEEFNVYLEVSLTPELAAACEAASVTYEFDVTVTAFRFSFNDSASDQGGKIFTAKLYKDKNKLAANVTGSLKSLGVDGINPCNYVCPGGPKWLAGRARDALISTYFISGHLKTTNGKAGYSLGDKTSFSPPQITVASDGAPHPVDPNFPTDVAPSGGIEAGVNGILYDALTFRVGMDGVGLDADKYRHFFRVTFADGGWVAVGKATPTTTPTTYDNLSPPHSLNKFSLLKALLISPFAVQEARAQNTTTTTPPTTSTSTPTSSTYDTSLVSLSGLKIPIWMSSEATGGIAWGSNTSTKINYSSAAQLVSAADKDFASNAHPLTDLSVIAIETKKSADPKVCGPLKLNKQQIACSKSGVAYILPEAKDGILTKDHKKFPFSADATQLKQLGVKDATDKTPVLSDVYLAPTIQVNYTWKDLAALFTPVAGFAAGNIIGSYYGFSYTADAQHLFFEVYSSKAELEAHKNDAPPAGVTPYSETVTSSSTSSSDTAADLFNFLRKVISYLVLLCTSVIYWIFATILVPILNSLLSIRPYQDQFVNFIYPGWVIMRNLANIVFILALLWMGLRTLFQVDDSSKTRGLILWLILMALLVNFSLVIAQGVVGIADTVQSQFLPKESKVIEALGQKLMVDPIKFFRGQNEQANITTNSNFTVSSSAADITKPIVLLILALAAFFSFVALVGFILMRLVALWLLYMISPIAYAARILPETKQYFDKWWDQFIRNAFTVPILALFLNIAALMATTFAKRSGDSVIAGRDPNYILGSASGGVVDFSLTVMSHFIVLFFIYAGMYYANQSGALGSKQIVKFAKSGFDTIVKSLPQKAWQGVKSAGGSAASLAGGLKDRAGEGLANSKFLQGKEKSQMAVRSIFRPKEAFKAVKKGYWDNPNALLNKGFADSFDKMSKKIQPWGEDKLLPAKMAYWKLMGQKPGAFRTDGEKMSMQAEIMNNDERNKIANDRGAKQQKLNSLNNGLIDLSTARTKLKDLDKDVVKANKDYTADKSVENRDKLRNAVATRKGLNDEINRVVAAGGSEIDSTKVSKGMFDVASMKAALQDSIDKATKEIDADQNLRAKTGFGNEVMNDAKRKELLKDASALVAKAESREKPFSKTLEKEDAADVLKATKEIKDLDLDYEQMESGFEDALKKNNSVQARAYLKQITESGMLDRLLKNKDKDYNAGGLADLVKESFKSSSRNQTTIIREISNAAAKSGNLPLAYAVKSLQNGAGVLKSAEKQMKDVSDKMQKTPLKDLKSGDVKFYNSITNKTEITPGLVDSIKAHNGEEKAKVVARDMNKKVATDILNQLTPAQKSQIGENIHSALKSAAGR